MSRRGNLCPSPPVVLFALLSLFCASSHALDPHNLYLKTGVQAGLPHGVGLSARVVAYVFNLETNLNYGYYLNTAQLGMGLRVPMGERNEIFLNLGVERVLSKKLDLNISGGAWAEIQHERKFGRQGFSTFAALGLVLYPEDNELSLVYGLPVIKLGVRKEILGF